MMDLSFACHYDVALAALWGTGIQAGLWTPLLANCQKTSSHPPIEILREDKERLLAKIIADYQAREPLAFLTDLSGMN